MVTRGFLSLHFATRVHRFAALSQLSQAVKNQEKPLGPGYSFVDPQNSDVVYISNKHKVQLIEVSMSC